jgi:hypothetical protein
MLEQAKKIGRVKDKVTVIFDRTGMKTDIKLLSYIVPIFQQHYPETLSRAYVFPTNSMFWVFWGMAGMVFDPATITKAIDL